MRRRSTIRRKFVLFLVAIGLVLVGSRWFLRSAYAAEHVASRLGAAAGAPVRFMDLDVGFSSTAITGLEVLERGAAPGSTPWLTIGSVDAGLTLLQLVQGDLASGVVKLQDVRVVLRFDRAGHLLTRLPEPVAGDTAPAPTIRVTDGSLTIRREGRPDETFRNITLELHQDGSQVLIDGAVEDPDWGPWKVLGNRPTSASPLAFNLQSRGILRVTPALLKRTPFVESNVWEQVSCEGDTPCEVAMQFNPAAPINYRVTLEPRNLKVYVRSIDLPATDVAGKVIVADGIVTLENVRGHAAHGDFTMRSVIDFRGVNTIMRFSIDSHSLNLTDLPDRWNVPPLRGELNGRAELEVTIVTGRAIVRGQGEGTVRVFPLLRALKVQLVSDGQRLKFHVARD